MVLFDNTLNTFYVCLYGIGHIVKDHIAREEVYCHHYSFLVATRGLLYAPFHRQHSISYGALAGADNISMDPSWGITSMSGRSTMVPCLGPCQQITFHSTRSDSRSGFQVFWPTRSVSTRPARPMTESGFCLMGRLMPCGLRTWTRCWMTIRR